MGVTQKDPQNYLNILIAGTTPTNFVPLRRKHTITDIKLVVLDRKKLNHSAGYTES